MDELSEKALYYRIALETGLCTVIDVINWCDKEIKNSENPVYSLFTLSLMEKANPLDVLSVLKELAGSADRLKALRKVLADMYPILVSHPEYGPIFARGLYQIVVELDYDLPEHLAPICRLDDAYDLARDGIYGTENDVLKGFLEFLALCANDAQEADKSPHRHVLC